MQRENVVDECSRDSVTATPWLHDEAPEQPVRTVELEATAPDDLGADARYHERARILLDATRRQVGGFEEREHDGDVGGFERAQIERGH